MQVPVEWYVHVGPGLVYLASLFVLFVPRNKRYKYLKDLAALTVIVLPVLLLLAFVIGFVANAILIRIVRPILFPNLQGSTLNWKELLMISEQLPSHLISLLGSAYNHMVFLRSLFFSLLALSVLAGVKELFFPDLHEWKEVLVRTLKWTGVNILCLALFYEWISFRFEYQKVESSLKYRLHHQYSVTLNTLKPEDSERRANRSLKPTPHRNIAGQAPNREDNFGQTEGETQR